MLPNYFKIAWRHLLKDGRFTILNLIGLSSGLACAFLVYAWVSNETRVDNFNKNGSQLYLVMQNVPLTGDGVMTTKSTPDLLAKALIEEIPGIEDVVTIKSPDPDDQPKGIISVNGSSIKAAELYVTPNFFNVFNFHLLQGDKDFVLSNTNNVLLSGALAMKLFHTDVNVIGKLISWNRGTGQSGTVNGNYIVSGIFEAPGSNSSLQFDLLFTHQLYVQNNLQYINWNNSNPSTYVLLKKGTNVTSFDKLIKNLIKTKTDPKWAGTLFLQRFSDTYLYNHYENGLVAGGRIDYVKLFSIIAIFILFIACINFMNLSTAKASHRIKEVGIKKVIGASRRTLIFQYIGEALMMVLISVFIAVIFVWLLFPAFKLITGKNLSLPFNAGLIISVLAITLVTGLVAGSYPALYLTGFRPVFALKGKLTSSAGESWVRKGLVVFQFTISIVLILSVMVVYQQMKLVQTKNLGYNKDHVISFANEGRIQQSEQTFLSEVKNIPGVLNASDQEGDMFGNHSGGGGIDWPGKTNRIEFSGIYADYDFMETMGLQMKEGRMFSRKFATDSDGVIFNETAIAEMNLKDPIGKTVKLWGVDAHIIGVVKDFHFESLYNKIGPFFLSFRKNCSNILVKIKPGTETGTLARLKELYQSYNPGLPFEYRFLDEEYQVLYASEQRVAVLSRYFAGLAILISCLGLFGLAAFTAQKRQKEIGIRKVVGATVSQVVLLLSKDFLKLVLFALMIAFPLALWMMNTWLQSFAYRIHIQYGIFLIAGGLIFFLTLLTVGFQSIKTAIINPVKSLRVD